MELALYLKAFILGIVEGLTEFLPISSTGHLIIASELLGFNDERGKVFEIVIQSGAMLAVIWEYRGRFGRLATSFLTDVTARRFGINLLIAFLPAALLGLAFKPDTDDLRDAPSLTIAESLLAMGARVKAFDPIANEVCFNLRPDLDIVYAESAEDLVEGCDAVVLVTEWDDFKRLDPKRVSELMAGDLFIDARNVVDPEALRRAGLRGEGIGRT